MTRRLRMNLLLGCAVVAGMYMPGAWRSLYATPIVHASMAAGGADSIRVQDVRDAHGSSTTLERNEERTP